MNMPAKTPTPRALVGAKCGSRKDATRAVSARNTVNSSAIATRLTIGGAGHVVGAKSEPKAPPTRLAALPAATNSRLLAPLRSAKVSARSDAPSANTIAIAKARPTLLPTTAVSVETWRGAGTAFNRFVPRRGINISRKGALADVASTLDTVIFHVPPALLRTGITNGALALCKATTVEMGLSSVMLRLPPFHASAASQSSPVRTVYEYSFEGPSVAAIRVGAAYAVGRLCKVRAASRANNVRTTRKRTI